MNSFNVYGQTETKIGGHTPVWLGTVKPIPVGAKGHRDGEGYMFIPAGTACVYSPETGTFSAVLDPNDAGGSFIKSANAYVYNDIYVEGTADYTCALVMHHPEGLLIERVYPEITEEQIQALQAQIPGVLLIRG